jgi:ribosomal protein L7/L12
MQLKILRSSIEADDLTISEQHHVKIVDTLDTDDPTRPRDPKAVGWDHKFMLSAAGNILIDRIDMIKLVRALTGWGLKESKDWVERLIPKP